MQAPDELSRGTRVPRDLARGRVPSSGVGSNRVPIMHSANLFGNSIQKSQSWVDEIDTLIDWDDRRSALRALRLVLHVWRDRLPLNESAQFAAQMPTLIRGIYYEGWRPSETPDKRLTRSELLLELEEAFPDYDAETICRAVCKVIARHVSPGEIRDIQAALPKPLRELWIEPAPLEI